MDQGDAVAIDGRTSGWTPLRVALVLLGAVLGGLLLSVITGGVAAHADAPGTPPPSIVAATSTAAENVITPVGHRLFPAAAPSTAPAGPVLATVLPNATSGAAAPLPSGSSASAVSAADGLLDRGPLAATPAWSAVIGPHPVGTILAPVASVLHDAVSSLGPLLAPVLGASLSARSEVVGAAIAPTVGRLVSEVRAVLGSGASGAPTGAGALLPSAPRGLPTMPTAAISSGGSAPVLPASVLGAMALLLLALTRTRRDDGALPSSPVYATDSSPD